MIYEFAYAPHQSANGEQCPQSGRIIPHNVVIHAWGRNYDSASCIHCGRSVQAIDVECGLAAQPGDKVYVG